MSDDTALGPGAEFDLIRAMQQRWGALAMGLGDDAASIVVPSGETLVASLDASLEGVHFRRAWLTPREIGYRATTAALSDLAAMGAAPLGVLVALALPVSWRAQLEPLADGIGDAVRAVGTRILGGDLTGGSALAVTVTVLGSVAAPLTRRGARVGDAVYVTGRLGGPAAAVRAWEKGDAPREEWRARFAQPAARIEQARWLAAHGAHAAIDISDGLVADLRHVAAASGVRLVLALDALPMVGGVSVAEAASSGEEYEVAVTAPALDAAAFVRQFGVPLTELGRVEAGAPDVVVTAGGAAIASLSGFDHFS